MNIKRFSQIMFAFSAAFLLAGIISAILWSNTTPLDIEKKQSTAKAAIICFAIAAIFPFVGLIVAYTRQGKVDDIDFGSLGGDEARTLREKTKFVVEQAEAEIQKKAKEALAGTIKK